MTTERPYNPESIDDRRILAESMTAMIVNAKFKLVSGSATEDVYEFPIEKVPGAKVKVFTSVFHGLAREKDADAIRVAMVFTAPDGKSEKTLVDDARVFRTGTIEGITGRTLSRMRAVFTGLQGRIKEGLVCRRCGAPLFDTKKGTKACAALCFTKLDKPEPATLHSTHRGLGPHSDH